VLQLAAAFPAIRVAQAARKEFWDTKEPAAWTEEEKQVLLGQSPWALQGSVRLAKVKSHAAPPPPLATEMPGARPGNIPGGVNSVPIGEKPPPVPRAEKGPPVEFRVLARWESATPVRLAGAELPEEIAGAYVIRLRGMPLLPPPADNQSLLQAIKDNTRLLRQDKPGIACSHLLTGSGNKATELLLFFPRGADPITLRDKTVTLDSPFGPFQLSIRFTLKDMLYKGELAL
jgi:hypothetical protein